MAPVSVEGKRLEQVDARTQTVGSITARLNSACCDHLRILTFLGHDRGYEPCLIQRLVRWRIHPAMAFEATGARVSSSLPYSETAPVTAV